MRPISLAIGLSSSVCALTVISCSADNQDGMLSGASESALSTILENNTEFPNPTGRSASFSTNGSVDLAGAFFQSLGTNGRTCGTCHLTGDGWTVSARSAQDQFDASAGLGAL